MKKLLLLTGVCLFVFSAAGFDTYKAAVTAGSAARTAKEWDKSVVAYGEALKLATKESEKTNALYMQADSYRLAGKIEEARTGFTAVLANVASSQGQKGWSQLRLAEILRLEKKYDEAIAEYIKVETIDKATCVAEARLGIAICYRSQNKHEELRQRCRDVLTMEKISVSTRLTAVNMIGDSFYAEKNYTDAAKTYAEVSGIEGATQPQCIDAYNKSGNAYNQAAMYDAAISALNKVIIHEQASAAQKKRAEDGLKRANDGKAKQARKK